MNTADRSRLLQALRSRRDEMAERWYEAVVLTSVVPLSATALRQRLTEFTEQVIVLLVADRFEPSEAEAVGAALASLGFHHPESLKATCEALTCHLVTCLPAHLASRLWPRLGALLGGVAVGHLSQTRATILAHQEQIYQALVSVLRRTQEELRDSEARYRTISELILNFAYAVDVGPDGAVAYDWVTDGFTRITGFALEEGIARGGFLGIVHPDDRPFASLHLERLRSGEPDVCDFRIVSKSGEVRWVRNYGRPVQDGTQGDAVRIYGAAQDITEHRRMERHLRESERLVAVGRFAAALAHEVNNPLQVILANLELVLDFELEAGERREYLEIVRREIEGLVELTQRALNLARPPEDTRYPIHMTRLMERALTLTRQKLEQGQIQVTTDFSADLSPVVVVPNQIVQVLLNLTLNAIEAMPDGGRLHIAARMDGDRLALTLTDDGPAIPPGDLEHLFDAFFTTKREGTGLGLTISYRIVQQHGGTITVENLGGDRGVAFTVSLPAVPVAGQQEVAA